MWAYDLATEVCVNYGLPKNVSLSKVIEFIELEYDFECGRLKNAGTKRPNKKSVQDTVSTRIRVWLSDRVWVIENITDALSTYRIPYIFFRTISRNEVV